jgi:3-hydroxyisobutyrate dehydrogenase-like beta-hydroxyacid dehydrogenase
MKTIAVLFPGDMGGALSRILSADGHKVVTLLEGRSARTRATAKESGVVPLDSWSQLVEESHLVISLVPPSAVVPVAESFAAAARSQGSRAIFVDANAKTPEVASQVASIIGTSLAGFINACVVGGASSLREKGTIFVSGPGTSPLAEAIGKSVQVRDLGGDLEKVSAFKLAFSGFNKTIAAAWFETALAANAYGIFDVLFDEIARRSPGAWSQASRSFGTYSRHVARRGDEMGELAAMLKSRGVPNGVASGAASTFRAVAEGRLLSEETEGLDGRSLLQRLSINNLSGTPSQVNSEAESPSLRP